MDCNLYEFYRKLIRHADDGFFNGSKRMSFKLGLNRVQEALIMGLMIVLVFAMFSGIELTDKINLGVIVFALIFLTTMANQLLEQMKDRNKK